MREKVVFRLAAAGTAALNCEKSQAAVPAAAKHNGLTKLHFFTFKTLLARKEFRRLG
ncbi:MAG: hypothetical protein JXB10_10435 [Pirellulales bacterium]|nr:hypothetical protein [Pirellulales bacterium]